MRKPIDVAPMKPPGGSLLREVPGISVVVPVLNEEARMAQCLRNLLELAGVAEIVVVDGGSSDRTVEIAQRFTNVVVLFAPRGRAAQMNVGAAAAAGEVILFLHADVRLPADAAVQVERALRDGNVVAGAFRTWTVDERPRASWIAPLLHLADLRSRYSRLPYGDQAIFVRSRTFRSLGGFAAIPLMEDLELSRRLRAVGRIRVVPAVVTVSGRRFLERPIYYFLLINLMPLLYCIGVPPRVLATFYANVR
ncbi:MAG: TIGR04283 family arsenosugar biosynthesis glycosyltransferase [Deltaproteobacteria bacterium]|nr:TIGR04283 family arsenosugar biosynthesis glycosyltransferase [Deltaproteobacteria bacterium]